MHYYSYRNMIYKYMHLSNYFKFKKIEFKKDKI